MPVSQGAFRREISANYLKLTEERLQLSAIKARYDLAIFSASWEARCEALPTLGSIACNNAILAYFSPSHAPKEVIDARLDSIESSLRDRGPVGVQRVPMAKSTDYERSLRILRQVVAKRIDRRKLVTVAIDLSSFPIGFVQGLIGWLVVQGIAASIDCFYVEPEYSQGSVEEAKGEKFTEGDWRLVAVPFLEGQPAGRYAKSAFVCLGAESGATRELLLGREYHEVALVRPYSDPAPSWSEQVDRDCDELCAAINITGGGAFPCNPFSVCEVAAQYMENVQPAWAENERMFVALGSKPHGLAGVICAIADDGLAVFARIPSAYVVRDVGAGENVWRYQLRDMSSPVWARLSRADWVG